MINRNSLVRFNRNQIKFYSSSTHHDWLSSFKHSFLSAFSDSNQKKLDLSKYNQLRLQSIQFPYLKRSLVDHSSISKLIRDLSLSQPHQSVELYNDLKSIWDFDPTDQDTLVYLSTLIKQAQPLPSQIPDHLRSHLLERSKSYHQAVRIARPTQNRSEIELAHLIRLSIKDNLDRQITDQLIQELPISEYRNPLLIHGALIFINDQSYQYILDRLNQNLALEPWIEIDLITKISQDVHLDFKFLTHVLTKILRHVSHHQHRNRSLDLVEIIMNHIQVSSCDPTPIDSLADQILETTGIEIFRDQPEKLAGRLFDRIPSILNRNFTFEQVVDWYQLSRTRGTVLINPLISILTFQFQLSNKPDLIDQIMSDFQSMTHLQSISPSNFIAGLIGFLRLSIYQGRPDLAETTFELTELGKNALDLKNQKKESLISQDVSIELMQGLVEISEKRDEAFKFYEHLIRLGNPNLKFFHIFLKEYLQLIEKPKVTVERPQALTIQRLMKILDDMKTFGIRPNNQTYSNLLNHFSSIVKKNPRNFSTRIQLERIHTLIKLDVNLEPDFHLLHQLFKAFSYNGLYDKAWWIWDKFFSSPYINKANDSARKRKKSEYKKISNASFATMFDLAGFESERFGDGRLNFKAIDAWDFLLQDALDQRSRNSLSKESQDGSKNCSLNKNLFDSWVECLCRSRRIEEAVDLIFNHQSIIESNNHDKLSIQGIEEPMKASDYLNQSTHSIPEDEQDQQRQVNELQKEILNEFIDQGTLSILLRFSNREDHLNLASFDFSSNSKNHPNLWSHKINQLILNKYPHLSHQIRNNK